MNRPPLEVADIIRSAGDTFLERSRRWITWHHRKVLLAILRCRTAALGGYRDRCSDCGHIAISYNSCGNRHCPHCQGNARIRWLQAREEELLPTRFGGPQPALRYLGAYTHRVAISNYRLVALEDGKVTFRWRDSAHGNKKKLMKLPADEFLRRF